MRRLHTNLWPGIIAPVVAILVFWIAVRLGQRPNLVELVTLGAALQFFVIELFNRRGKRSMWVAMKKPNGRRLLLNLDLTFCFDESDDGMAQAVSINGVAAPTGVTMETVIADIMDQEG